MQQYCEDINAYAVGGVNNNFPLVELFTNATDRVVISEIGLQWSIPTGGSPMVGLGVPAVKGVLPAGSASAVAAYDPNAPADLLGMANSWVSPPTIPTKFIRRATVFSNSNQVASKQLPLLWKFPRGLTMLPNTSLVLWLTNNVGTGSFSFSCWVERDVE